MKPALYATERAELPHVQKHIGVGRLALAGAVLFAAALLLQWLAGAYSAELAGHADEPAHYVTGLMVHDYLTAWPPANPIRFAENFYLHYPKVALGHWPPVFYMIQAVWTLTFPASYKSVLVLMALLTALLALSLHRAVEPEYGRAAGFACGLLLILLPTVQQFGAMVMTEISVALFCFWAAIQFGRYIETANWRHAAWFGIFATFAIMTKGSALALVLLPPLALAFTRRLDLLRRRATWLPAVMVSALCGPWYLLTLKMQLNGWTDAGDKYFLLRAFPLNTSDLFRLVGPPLFALAAIGLAVKLVRPLRSGRVAPRWAAMGALIVSVWIFQSVVPASQDIRHLITAAAPALLFAAAGTSWVAGRLPGFRMRQAIVGLSIAAAFAATTFQIPPKGDRGFVPMVQDILARPEFGKSVILISSQYDGEGIFISEMASRERRPGHIILRASKVLAEAQWNGAGYHVLYPTPDAVMEYLESVPVGILVMDNTPGTKDHVHHRQLEQVLRKYADRWRLIGVYPKDGRPRLPGEDVRVYALMDNKRTAHGKIQIDLTPMLGRSIGD